MSSKTDLPHVTEILSIFDRGFGRVPQDILAEAARVGTEVHRYALGWVRAGGVHPIPPPEDIAPYVEKVIDWIEGHVEEILKINGKPCAEWEFMHPMGFQGRVDLVARIRGDRGFSVVDLKRAASVDPFVGLQLAAYALGVERVLGKKIKRRIALRIPRDRGPCAAVEFRDHEGDAWAFLSALQLYRHLKGRERRTR